MPTIKHLTFKDKNNVKDKMVQGSASAIKPVRGRVQIHARDIGNGKKLYLVEDTSNLIVYRGRHWLMQRAFGQDFDANQSDVAPAGSRDWKDRYVRWFAIGTGGASIADPLTAESPSLDDCALTTHVDIGGTSYMETTDGNYQFKAFDSGYPKFIIDGDVPAAGESLCTDASAQDPVDLGTYYADNFLVSIMQITLAADEGNGTGYQDLSEAGLFCSESGGTFATISDLNIFARVTFSTIRKTSSRELVITWYVYF